MKKHVIAKQQHLYTKERFIMFDGIAECIMQDDLIKIIYIENDTNANVILEANEDSLILTRESEVSNHLHFKHKDKTIGKIHSEFGTLEVGIHTHKYIKKNDTIAIEYDILAADEVSDGFRIIWMIKEDIL